jgi:predicted nucleic acid-binding protein
MALAPGYLIDTNILLRLSRTDDPQHPLIKSALTELDVQGEEFYYSLQNMAEFWNVCTRPKGQNGYGLSITETAASVEYLETTMTFLPDNDLVYSNWRRLVMANNVRGVQVHDARLAAIMQAYGISHILTLNRPDFLRYSNVFPVHPNQIQPSPPII